MQKTSMLKRTVLLAIGAGAVASPLIAYAADVPFVGPAGWSHDDLQQSADGTRKYDKWHIAGDVASVTYIADSNSQYADALALIEKNFQTNKIKPAIDKDIPCQGKTGHVVEFAVGPDEHKIVINRLLVPNGAGVVTITYARADGSVFDADVKKSETAYCDATPTPTTTP